MAILCVTYSGDNDCVGRVMSNLVDAGEQVFRLNTDDAPADLMMHAQWGRHGTRTIIRNTEAEVDLNDVRAIWYRRNRIGEKLSRDIPLEHREVAVRECTALLYSEIFSLPAFQMDNFWTVRRASHKPLQLHVARQVGLVVPETTITNDAAAVRAFVERIDAPIIFKPVDNIAVGDQYPVKRVWTNRLTPQELESLEGLELSPMVFQEEIPKKLEVRATLVGDRTFVAAVDPSTVGADDDWRKQGDALMTSWVPHTLPEAIVSKLHVLRRKLGLQYGAADLILSPAGDYTFLEINPVGEFCWLDQCPGLGIGDAILDRLLKGAQGELQR